MSFQPCRFYLFQQSHKCLGLLKLLLQLMSKNIGLLDGSHKLQGLHEQPYDDNVYSWEAFTVHKLSKGWTTSICYQPPNPRNSGLFELIDSSRWVLKSHKCQKLHKPLEWGQQIYKLFAAFWWMGRLYSSLSIDTWVVSLEQNDIIVL